MKHGFYKAVQEGRNDILSYFLTLVIMIGAVILAQFPVTYYIIESGQASEMATTGNLDMMNLGVPESVALFLMLLSFAAGLFGLIALMKPMHKRRFMTLFTFKSSIDWKKVGFSALLWFILAGLAELVAYSINPEIYTWTFDASRFFPVLIVALIMFPLQTTFEEVVFRGYLMQGFGLIFKNAVVPLIITSLLFGLMHGANPEVMEFGSNILWYYVGTGLFLGVITLMDETLELAMGVHAANNLFGAIFVTFPSSAVQTPALITISEYKILMMIAFWVVMVIIYMLVVSKKYGWSNWKKLIERIEYSEEETMEKEAV